PAADDQHAAARGGAAPDGTRRARGVGGLAGRLLSGRCRSPARWSQPGGRARAGLRPALPRCRGGGRHSPRALGAVAGPGGAGCLRPGDRPGRPPARHRAPVDPPAAARTRPAARPRRRRRPRCLRGGGLVNIVDALAIPVLVLSPLIGAVWLLVADRVSPPPRPRVSRGIAVGA